MAETDVVHVYRPGRSARTLVLFHGTGGDESSLLRFAPHLDSEAGVLSVRGQSLDEGYPRFFRRLAEGVFDEADLVDKVDAMADFLAHAYARNGIDPGQTVAFGYSNGANMAAAMWMLRPEAMRHGIFVRPMVPLSPNPVPDLTGRAGLLLIGEGDAMCPPGSGERLAEMLRSYGAEIEAIVQPAGHEMVQADLRRAAEWLDGLSSESAATEG